MHPLPVRHKELSDDDISNIYHSSRKPIRCAKIDFLYSPLLSCRYNNPVFCIRKLNQEVKKIYFLMKEILINFKLFQ